jgi:hypothetical protein
MTQVTYEKLSLYPKPSNVENLSSPNSKIQSNNPTFHSTYKPT